MEYVLLMNQDINSDWNYCGLDTSQFVEIVYKYDQSQMVISTNQTDLPAHENLTILSEGDFTLNKEQFNTEREQQVGGEVVQPDSPAARIAELEAENSTLKQTAAGTSADLQALMDYLASTGVL